MAGKQYDEKVELIPAHTWDCPFCAHENFARCVVLELGPIEKAEILAEHGLGPEEDGLILTKPVWEACCACVHEYQTNIYNADPEKPFFLAILISR